MFITDNQTMVVIFGLKNAQGLNLNFKEEIEETHLSRLHDIS